MTTKYLTLKLDGKRHEEHTASAAQLLETLHGFVDSITEANKLLNGQGCGSPEIEIKAFNPGSFEILAIVNYGFDVIENVKHIDPLEYIGYIVGAPVAHGVANSAVDLIRNIAGRRKTKSYTSEDGKVTVEVDDGSKVEVSDEKIVELVESPTFRQSLAKVFQNSVKYDGTDSISIIQTDKDATPIANVPPKKVTTAESKFFIPKLSKEESVEEVVYDRKSVYFTKINFKSGKGWEIELPDGTSQKVEILDDVFLQKTLKRYQEDKTVFSSDALFDVELQSITNIDQFNVHSKPKVNVTKIFKQLTKRDTEQ